MVDSVKTLCPHCSVGCGLELSPLTEKTKKNKSSWKVKGDRLHPSSQGMICVKGTHVTESLDQNRLQYPLIRDSLIEPWRRCSWDEAIDKIVERIQFVRQTQGADAICMLAGGNLYTEDYYLAQKLIKGCLGTNNFDICSAASISSLVKVYQESFGSDGPVCTYDDLKEADCVFLIGTNLAESYPIIAQRLQKYLKKKPKVKLIIIDSHQTKISAVADLHLKIRPGTEIYLLNAIAHLLLRWGEINSLFIDECTQGFPKYAQTLEGYPPNRVAKICEISVNEIIQAAKYWSKANRLLSLWSVGSNPSARETTIGSTLINLHLMTRQIGQSGTGPFFLSEQTNAMGGREAGGLPHLLPGYRSVINLEHRREVEEFWGLPLGTISSQPGRELWQIITGLEQKEIGLLWIAAHNPLATIPDSKRAKTALAQSPFTIYQDGYYPTETAAYAHLLLPVAQWGETIGTMTNSERIVTLLPQFRLPPLEAKTNWEIFAQVGKRLGFNPEFDFPDSEAIHAEFVQLTRGSVCDMTGISYAKLRSSGPLRWPYPEAESMNNRPLYSNFRFATPDGRARFAAIPFTAYSLDELIIHKKVANYLLLQ